MKNMTGHNLCWMNLIKGVKKEEKRSKNTKKEGKRENINVYLDILIKKIFIKMVIPRMVLPLT